MNPRRPAGHIGYDFVILVFILAVSTFFIRLGLSARSLAATLFGAWGLSLTASFFGGVLLGNLAERLEGKVAGFSPGLYLPPALAGGLAGAAWGFCTRSWMPVLGCFFLGCASGAALGLCARRFPRAGAFLDDLLSESILLTALAYVVIPLLLVIWAAVAPAFSEMGFVNGAKITGVFAVLIAAAAAFLWALNTYPLFSKLVVAAVVFGFVFGLEAFFTALFLLNDRVSPVKLYSTLGVEAAIAAGVGGWALYKSIKGGPA